MAENPIRFGIIGCAAIARKLSRAITLAPNATLSAVASRSLEKAAKFAAANNFPSDAKIYGSYESLLDDPDIDAVYVPLPTSLHLKWAVCAANKKKHVLLEKPVALNVAEFDEIINACDANGVQFMDGTMWMHHPRTAKMREFVADSQRFGCLKSGSEKLAGWNYVASAELKILKAGVITGYFLKNDIRVKPDLDAHGALGDAGWYGIRALLWSVDYEMPKTVTALRDPVFNEAGVILSCAASLCWVDGKVATFYCSFLSNLTMDITVIGTKGTLHIHDFVVPYQESQASFKTSGETGLNEHTVAADIPQEACMVMEFARLVENIKVNGAETEKRWPTISRRTQMVMDKVKLSIAKGFEQLIISCGV